MAAVNVLASGACGFAGGRLFPGTGPRPAMGEPLRSAAAGAFAGRLPVVLRGGRERRVRPARRRSVMSHPDIGMTPTCVRRRVSFRRAEWAAGCLAGLCRMTGKGIVYI